MTAKIVDLIESKTIQLEEYRETKDKKSSKKAQLLESGIESLRAYDRIQIADRVTHLTQDYGIGVVTDKAFSTGDMPLIWVNWNDSTVPTPEQPNLLVVCSNGQDSTDSRDNEIIELEKLESVIYSSMKADFKNYISRGEALLTIQEKKLHRIAGYSSLGDYYNSKFGMSRRYAEYQIRAFKVIRHLQNANNCAQNLEGTHLQNANNCAQNLILPVNENQCRELAKLPKDKQVEVWQELTEDGTQPTATQIRDVVQQIKFIQSEENHEPLPVWKVGQEVVVTIKNKTDKELNRFHRSFGVIQEITELGSIVVEVWQVSSPPVTLPPVRPDELAAAGEKVKFDNLEFAIERVREWRRDFDCLQSALNHIVSRYQYSCSTRNEFKQITNLIKRKKNEQNN